MILRDPNSEVVAVSSHLGFSTLSIKCLFVCGRQEVKRGTGCQVSECCNEGLGQSQGLFMFWQIWDWGWLNCRGLPTPFDFSSLLLPFACLHFPSVQFHCLSFLNLLSFLLPSLDYIPFFFSHSLNFSCVDFSHCPLFPSLIVPLSSPHFYVSHAGCFSLPAAVLLMSYPHKRLLSWAWRQPG